MTINELRIREWVEALRSDRFSQTTCYLHQPGTPEYCALGVACEISQLGDWDSDGYYTIFTEHDCTKISEIGDTVLPVPVAQYYGLNSCNPKLKYKELTEGISQLNDDYRLSFKAIADLIEQQYL